MDIRAQLLQFAVALSRKGHIEEACQIRMVAHYVPEEGDDVPSFWRKNYDYGEGLYHGDTSEKPPVAEWLKKHRRKGPNFPKKRAAALSSEIMALIEQNPDKSGGEIYKLWEREHQDAPFTEQVSVRQQLMEYDEEKAEAEKRLQEEEQEGLDWEEWGEKLANERTFLAELPEGFKIFPPGSLERAYIPRTRGTTELWWGEGDPGHIEKSRDMITEIRKHNLAVVEIPGWPEGYVAVEYNDRGTSSVVLQNIAPMKKGVESKRPGVGNATYVIPQYVDGEHWTQFLATRPRGEVAEIVRQKIKEGEPGWQRHNRGSFEQMQLLEAVLQYSKGE